MISKRGVGVALFAAATLLLMLHEPAFAQASGESIFNWIMTNIVRWVVAAGIVAGGVWAMMGHHTLAGLVGIAAGAIVIAQWQTLLGLIGIG